MLKYLAILFSFIWAFLLASIWHNFTNNNCESTVEIESKNEYEKSIVNIIPSSPDSIFIVSDSIQPEKPAIVLEKEKLIITDVVDSNEIEKLLRTAVDVKFLNNSSYFDESNELKNYLVLAKDYLIKNPKSKLLICGHTDSDGASKQNKRFSVSRAIRMREKLLKEGFKGNQLEIHGKGESEPIVPNDSEKNRAINRRVSIKLK